MQFLKALNVMKSKKYKYVWSLVLALLATGCAVTDIDRSANFQSYKTFAWGEASIEVKNPLYRGELIDKEIKSTIRSEFAKRGISLTNKTPDFLVNYQTYTEDKQRTLGSNFGYPFYYPFGFYGFRWGMPYYGYGGAYPQGSSSYTEGTLIIDIVDGKTKESVWRGSVSSELSSTRLAKQIDKGVKTIMKKYPLTPQQQLSLPHKEVVSE